MLHLVGFRGGSSNMEKRVGVGVQSMNINMCKSQHARIYKGSSPDALPMEMIFDKFIPKNRLQTPTRPVNKLFLAPPPPAPRLKNFLNARMFSLLYFL